MARNITQILSSIKVDTIKTSYWSSMGPLERVTALGDLELELPKQNNLTTVSTETQQIDMDYYEKYGC